MYIFASYLKKTFFPSLCGSLVSIIVNSISIVEALSERLIERNVIHGIYYQYCKQTIIARTGGSL